MVMRWKSRSFKHYIVSLNISCCIFWIVLDSCGVCKLIHRWMKGLMLKQDPYILLADYIQLDLDYNLIGVLSCHSQNENIFKRFITFRKNSLLRLHLPNGLITAYRHKSSWPFLIHRIHACVYEHLHMWLVFDILGFSTQTLVLQIWLVLAMDVESLTLKGLRGSMYDLLQNK